MSTTRFALLHGLAPVRVACADANAHLWAWRWEDALEFERCEFRDDDGPWVGCDDPPPELEHELMHEFFDFDDFG